MADHLEFRCHILEDGVISITTDKIPDALHNEADAAMETITKLSGGVRTTEQLHAGHGHAHDHVHEHTHAVDRTS